MRIDEQKRLLIYYNEIVPKVFSKSAYTSARLRGSIKTTHRGGRGRTVEIIFEECKYLYQKKIVQKLGNPYILVTQERSQTPVIEECFVNKLKEEAIDQLSSSEEKQKFREIFGVNLDTSEDRYRYSI